MNKRKREYANDYELRDVEQKNGKLKKKAVYVGKYYRYQMEDPAYRTLKQMFLVLTGAEVVLFLLMGGVLRVASLGANTGNASFYVMLPYVISLFPIIMCVSKAVMLYTAKRDLTFAQYDSYVRRFRDMAVGMLVLTAATAVGQLMWIILNRSQAGLQDILFFLCGAAMAGIAFFLRKVQDRYTCEEVAS